MNISRNSSSRNRWIKNLRLRLRSWSKIKKTWKKRLRSWTSNTWIWKRDWMTKSMSYKEKSITIRGCRCQSKIWPPNSMLNVIVWISKLRSLRVKWKSSKIWVNSWRRRSKSWLKTGKHECRRLNSGRNKCSLQRFQ